MVGNVIQSEAKNLYTNTLCIQILPPYGRLDDKSEKILDEGDFFYKKSCLI